MRNMELYAPTEVGVYGAMTLKGVPGSTYYVVVSLRSEVVRLKWRSSHW